MAYFNLLDSSGRFSAPSDEAIASLDDTGRDLIARIRAATLALDSAAAAIVANEKAITETAAEIAALQLIVPHETLTDLAKAQGRETQRRRAGLLIRAAAPK